jgi:hypothetical protein
MILIKPPAENTKCSASKKELSVAKCSPGLICHLYSTVLRLLCCRPSCDLRHTHPTPDNIFLSFMARRLVISAPAFLIGKINSSLGTQSTRLISACLSSLIKFAPMLCANGARACRFRDNTSVFPFGIKKRRLL